MHPRFRVLVILYLHKFQTMTFRPTQNLHYLTPKQIDIDRDFPHHIFYPIF